MRTIQRDSPTEYFRMSRKRTYLSESVIDMWVFKRAVSLARHILCVSEIVCYMLLT